MVSRSCCRMSAGSRCCALARPNALSLSLCTPRHRSQWHPLFHPALVPCAIFPSRLRVAKSPLPAPCRHASLEFDTGLAVRARQDSYLVSRSALTRIAQRALLALANAAAELDRFIGDPGSLLTVQDGVDVEV